VRQRTLEYALHAGVVVDMVVVLRLSEYFVQPYVTGNKHCAVLPENLLEGDFLPANARRKVYAVKQRQSERGANHKHLPSRPRRQRLRRGAGSAARSNGEGCVRSMPPSASDAQ
jgi:hypothetical protein